MKHNLYLCTYIIVLLLFFHIPAEKARANSVAYIPGSSLQYRSLNILSVIVVDFRTAWLLDTSAGEVPIVTALKAKQQDQGVKISWKGEQEMSINVYEIQRCVDDAHYETIALMFPWDNSAISNQYTYTDKAPVANINYYRIKIVDKNASYTYTYTVAAKMNIKKNDKILVSPNPTVGNKRI